MELNHIRILALDSTWPVAGKCSTYSIPLPKFHACKILLYLVRWSAGYRYPLDPLLDTWAQASIACTKKHLQ